MRVSKNNVEVKYPNNLRATRMKNNLTQKELCEELGMQQAVYSRYERGERDMPVSTAKMFCEYFNVSMNYLTCYREEEDLETIAEYKKRDEERTIEERVEELEKEMKIRKNLEKRI